MMCCLNHRPRKNGAKWPETEASETIAKINLSPVSWSFQVFCHSDGKVDWQSETHLVNQEKNLCALGESL
jgi:hypothetical protein